MHKVLILGPQGCGKGTQAKILAQKLAVPELSMGALLRDAVAEGGEFGDSIAAILARGELVSDVITLEVLKRRLARADVANGYVLDGYPRNEEQYQAYIAFDKPTTVLVITVPLEVSLSRLAGRATQEKRTDDNPEATAKRLEIYERDTKPVIARLREFGVVHDIDGTGSVEEVSRQIDKVFSL